MNTNKQSIQSSDHQAGRANSRLIFLLSLISASLTLTATTPNTGQKNNGSKPDPSCGGGPVSQVYDQSKTNLIGCQRTIMERQQCERCQTPDTQAGISCTCEAKCVGNGGLEWVPATQSSYLSTNSATFKANAVVDAIWQIVKLNADGSTLRQHIVTITQPLSCDFSKLATKR